MQFNAFRTMRLIDKYGRIHDYLRISLTDKCNLRCNYCIPSDQLLFMKHKELMTPDEIEQIAKWFVNQGVKKIRITGGEPFVRKEVNEIIDRLGKLRVELCATTNGIFIDQHIDTLKRNNLTSLNISLDTFDETSFKKLTGFNEFHKVKANLKLLKSEGFDVKINCVLMKSVNDHELSEFIEFGKQFNISVCFIEFMPFYQNGWDKSQVVESDEILSLLQANHSCVPIKPASATRNWRFAPEAGLGSSQH